jgi:hypothetical protein
MSKRTYILLLVIGGLAMAALNYLFWDWFVTSRCGCS